MSEQSNEVIQTGRARLVNFLVILVVLALGIGIGTLISYRVDATGPDSQLQIQSEGKPVAGGAFMALSRAFEEVSNTVEPTVVNINTESPAPPESEESMEFFHRFFDGPRSTPGEMRRSLGSGVIVDPKGYIITNSHVVEDATRITVSLTGGEEYQAKVIGSDQISDIAVIKISGSKAFPYARIGNSKGMRVGDWVIAIGSPFGLKQTVTAGIISTTGRTFEDGVGPSAYSELNDYLQTDAAINRGNSGGPLVNMNAEVVGINSFISTPSGGSAGIGFAVPSHLFVRVYNQILQSGKVARGWVGVSMNRFDFTPAMAKHFGVKQGSGALITQLVNENGKDSSAGPAAKAGVKPEDVVIAFDGKPIKSNQDFRMAVAEATPGKKTKVRLVRQGQEQELEIVIAERHFDQGNNRQSVEEPAPSPKAEIGLEIDDIPSHIVQALKLSGTYVVSVKPGSRAQEAGFVSGELNIGGDIIVAVNGKPISNKEELKNYVKSLKSGQSMVFRFVRVVRGETKEYITETCYTSMDKP